MLYRRTEELKEHLHAVLTSETDKCKWSICRFDILTEERSRMNMAGPPSRADV